MIVGISIFFCLVAAGWSLVVVRRLRDRRFLFLAALFLVMAARQGATLVQPGGRAPAAIDRYLELSASLLGLIVVASLESVRGMSRRSNARAWRWLTGDAGPSADRAGGGGDERENETVLLRSTEQLQRIADELPSLVAYLDADEEVRASEARFRAVFEQAAVGVAQLSADAGTILRANHRFCEILGMPREALEGHGWLEFMRPDDWAASQALMEQLGSGTIREFVVRRRLELAVGNVTWIQMTVSPLRQTGQRPTTHIAIIEDITALKEAEDSQQRLLAILEATPDFVGMVDRHGRTVFVNRAGRRLMGFRDDENLAQLTIADYHAPEVAETIDRIGIPAATRDGHWFAETVFTTRDGRSVPTSQVLLSHKLDDGTIEYFSTIARDITEQKRAEAALRASEERFRTLAENTSAIPWEVDTQTMDFTFVGPQAENVLGYPVSQWLTPGFWESRLHPEDAAQVPDRRAQCERERGEFELEYRMIDAAGRIVWIHDVAHVVRRDRRPVKMAGYLIDVTARKEAQLQLQQSQFLLRRVLDTNPASVFVKDRDSRVLLANQAMAGFYGLDVADVTGRLHAELHAERGRNPQELEHWLADDRHVIDTGQRLEMAETGTDRHNVLHHYHTLKCPLELEPGRRAVLVITQDVTARRQAEAALQASEEKLRELNASLERRVADRTAVLAESNADLEAFAHSVSHDLRAPLRGMDGFAAALWEDYGDRLDENARQYIRHIMESARRMDMLVNDLLAYSRLGRSEWRAGSIELHAVITEAMSQLSLDIQSSDARVDVSDRMPAVHGHRSTLVQVVANLLSNAIKFVDSGVQPAIRVWAEPQERHCVRLWVEDNGIGIDREYHGRIFRVFERLHGMDVYPGTGIGLAIVARACERLRGRYGVQSEVGEGSRFWVEFPAGAPRR